MKTIAKTIMDVGFQIHKLLGPRFFESVNEEIMYFELTKAGMDVERQKGIPVFWDDRKMELGF